MKSQIKIGMFALIMCAFTAGFATSGTQQHNSDPHPVIVTSVDADCSVSENFVMIPIIDLSPATVYVALPIAESADAVSRYTQKKEEGESVTGLHSENFIYNRTEHKILTRYIYWYKPVRSYRIRYLSRYDYTCVSVGSNRIRYLTPKT